MDNQHQKIHDLKTKLLQDKEELKSRMNKNLIKSMFFDIEIDKKIHESENQLFKSFCSTRNLSYESEVDNSTIETGYFSIIRLLFDFVPQEYHEEYMEIIREINSLEKYCMLVDSAKTQAIGEMQTYFVNKYLDQTQIDSIKKIIS